MPPPPRNPLRGFARPRASAEEGRTSLASAAYTPPRNLETHAAVGPEKTSLRDRVREVFAVDGTLARAREDYRPRPEQGKLAAAVADTLETRGRTLIAHAPTGIGKTLAYLVPALLADGRVVVSTGTVPLQDQVAGHEIPRLLRFLQSPRTPAVLKGRTHYLCRFRLDRLVRSPDLPGFGAGVLARLEEWAERSDVGDLDRFPESEELLGIRPQLVTTAEACTGSACAFFDRCFVYRARRRAQEADVVVVNHHLLLTDLLLKKNGFGALLPEADAFVVDEAHRLPDLLFTALADGYGTARLEEFGRDFRRWAGRPGAPPTASDALARYDHLLARLRRETVRAEGGAMLAESQRALESLGALFAEIAEVLDRTTVGAEEAADHASLRERSRNAAEFFARWREAHETVGAEEAARAAHETEDGPDETGAWTRPLAWIEGSGPRAVFRLLADDPRRTFAGLVRGTAASWAFLSATLAVAERLEPFQHQIGLRADETLILPSPFDYTHQGLFYTPTCLPPVNSPEYPRAYLELLADLVRETDGGAFLLFTSRQALVAAAEDLRGRLGGSRRLLVQDTGSRTELLERFRRDGRAVLVATQTFWEGVDVPGSALRLVAIDRLPFASPEDPLSRIKGEVARREGDDAFLRYTLPQAVVSLCQGVGRLLRHEDDRGLVVVGDSRLRTAAYRRAFLESLPPFRRTLDRSVVARFLEDVRASSGA